MTHPLHNVERPSVLHTGLVQDRGDSFAPCQDLLDDLLDPDFDTVPPNGSGNG